MAFVSGTPQPNESDITWHFNGQSLPSSLGVVERGNALILPGNVQFEIDGRYTCQVTTSAGNSSDDFLVIVTGMFWHQNVRD